MSPVDMIMVPASVTGTRLIYCQTGHLFCALLWREKCLVACPEGRKKETTKTRILWTALIGMMSPTPALCNNCLWSSPRNYQLLPLLLVLWSIYSCRILNSTCPGQKTFKRKRQKILEFFYIFMKAIRLQNVCYGTIPVIAVFLKI